MIVQYSIAPEHGGDVILQYSTVPEDGGGVPQQGGVRVAVTGCPGGVQGGQHCAYAALHLGEGRGISYLITMRTFVWKLIAM